MPDIFLSYNREDQTVARRFVDGFERAGLSVWWDTQLDPGEAYDEVTEKALLGARAVVVLWSKTSVASRWVRAEATQADRNKTLVPVTIEPCTRPIMFELTQTAELSQWQGDTDDPAWQAFLAGVLRFIGRNGGEPPVAPAVASASVRSDERGRSRLVAAAVAVLALLLIGGGIYWATHRGAGAPVARTAAGTSLAVLPFVDLSPERDQEYFSDGLAEELLNQLAQLKELRVAGRTSSFSFKGKNEDLRVIGSKLGVAHILEGSVRKAGNRLRVTAQLIDAANGTSLWSQTFERELSDIFAVQDEIAMGVTQALSITLDVGSMSRANGGTTSVAAYDRYLKAQAQWHRGGREYEQAAALYREALAADPAFARAWFGLHRSAEQARLRNADPAATLREMEEASARLTTLAPDAWWTLTTQVAQLVQQHKWGEAAVAGAAAVAAAKIPETELAYGVFLSRVGRIQEALPYVVRASQAEPLSHGVSTALQAILDAAGRRDEAEAEYVRSTTLEGGGSNVTSLFALFRRWSRQDTDAAGLEARLRAALPTSPDRPVAGLFGITLENWNDRPAARAALRRFFEARSGAPRFRGGAAGTFVGIADHYGEKDMVLTVLRESLVDRREPNLLALWLWNESGWRSDPLFKDILRDLGLVDYYRSSGRWPDFCNPVGANDFECH